jgi:hypothetical protein
MLDAEAALKQSDWKTRSAEETATILNGNFGPDECDRLMLIALMLNIAVYDRQQNDALFWSVVFARREGRALSEATRRELQALLDDSRNWGA